MTIPMRIDLPSIPLPQAPPTGCLPLFALFVCLMAGLLSNLPAVAAQLDPSRITTVTVGGDRDYPPYEFLDKDGQWSG